MRRLAPDLPMSTIASKARDRAMTPVPVPRSTTTQGVVRASPWRSARRRSSSSATATTCSVSGRGTRARGSTATSSCRNDQEPRMYCNGSPPARRWAMRCTAIDGIGGHRAVEQREEFPGGDARGLGHEPLCLRLRIAQPSRPTPPGERLRSRARGTGVRRGHPPAAAAPPSSIPRSRSSTSRASTRSSRSPSRTRSSLCRVSLIRWSVTRFSLKL